jgi:hypothetical protein
MPALRIVPLGQKTHASMQTNTTGEHREARVIAGLMLL